MDETGPLAIKIKAPEANLAEHLRDLADYHYTLGNQLEELAGRQDRIENDPGFKALIAEAEDQVIGDDLLTEMQRPGPVDDTGDPRVVPPESITEQRSVIHNADPDHDHTAS